MANCKYGLVCSLRHDKEHYCSVEDADISNFGPGYDIEEDILLCQEETWEFNYMREPYHNTNSTI